MAKLTTQERLEVVTKEIYDEMNKRIKNDIKLRDMLDTQRELQRIVNGIERNRKAY